MNMQSVSRRSFLTSSLAGMAAAAGAAAAAAAVPSDAADVFDSDADALAEAWRLVEEDGCCRVIVRGREIVSKERGRGTGPFLRLLDSRPDVLRGARVVDSTVGIASAAVAVKGGAAKVFARTASEGARDVLARAGIPLEARVVVPHILNRDLSGPCPLESGVAGLAGVDEILVAARQTLAGLRTRSMA